MQFITAEDYSIDAIENIKKVKSWLDVHDIPLHNVVAENNTLIITGIPAEIALPWSRIKMTFMYWDENFGFNDSTFGSPLSSSINMVAGNGDIYRLRVDFTTQDNSHLMQAIPKDKLTKYSVGFTSIYIDLKSNADSILPRIR